MSEAFDSTALELGEDDELVRAGEDAADRICAADPKVSNVVDPREAAFANAVIDRLAHWLGTMPGVIRQVLQGAANAAEDLNVETFQGLVEVIQNADDLGASEVRLALREHKGKQQLLVVHDGSPVVCQHVLAMTLPFLTTKADDATQKGRFGIGLKTLSRISSRLAVHCQPYHFKAENRSIARIAPEAGLGGFYNAATDTLIVLDLAPSFREEALKEWLDGWEDDGLLFLEGVRAFRWCNLFSVRLNREGRASRQPIANAIALF